MDSLIYMYIREIICILFWASSKHLLYTAQAEEKEVTPSKADAHWGCACTVNYYLRNFLGCGHG